MRNINRGKVLVSLLITAMFMAGCRKPQPSTWPGFRRAHRKQGEQASQPPRASRAPAAASRKSPWWKPWARKRQPGTKPRVVQPSHKPDNDFDRAVALIKQRNPDFRGAKTLLGKVLERDPNYAEAWRWLGDCQYNLLELDAAITSYTKARDLEPTNYYALRGKGFAHLHKGRLLYQDYKQAVRQGNKKQAGEKLSDAHENFKLSLEILRECLRLEPADSEALYGRAIAAEGASRKLYSNAVVMLQRGDTPKANAWAERCLEIVDEGIEAAKHRINQDTGDPNPRVLVAGLFYRRAKLLKKFGRVENAAIALKKALITQQSILDDIDANNRRAAAAVKAWGKELDDWKAQLRKGAGS